MKILQQYPQFFPFASKSLAKYTGQIFPITWCWGATLLVHSHSQQKKSFLYLQQINELILKLFINFTIGQIDFVRPLTIHRFGSYLNCISLRMAENIQTVSCRILDQQQMGKYSIFFSNLFLNLWSVYFLSLFQKLYYTSLEHYVSVILRAKACKTHCKMFELESGLNRLFLRKSSMM